MATDWITTADAIKLSGYSADYLRELIRAGKIKGRKFGIVWQVSKRSLAVFQEAARQSSDSRRGPKR